MALTSSLSSVLQWRGGRQLSEDPGHTILFTPHFTPAHKQMLACAAPLLCFRLGRTVTVARDLVLGCAKFCEAGLCSLERKLCELGRSAGHTGDGVPGHVRTQKRDH